MKRFKSICSRTIDDIDQRFIDQLLDNLVSALQKLTEHRLTLKEFTSHLIVLRALTGKHPDHLFNHIKGRRNQPAEGRDVFSILIRRTSPVRTFPGPSSRNS